jgi:endoglucanase
VLCSGKLKAFEIDRPNPNVITGALVGGPDAKDTYLDVRAEYHYTEVALDYNAGLTAALAALMASPNDFWDTDCSKWVPTYPW